MHVYKRNVDKKLTSLRACFVILILLGTFSVLNKNQNLAYLIGTFTLFGGLITISSFQVYLTSFVIVKYYFFGLIAFRSNFANTDKIDISPKKFSFQGTPNIPSTEDGSTGLSALYGCLYPSLGNPKIGKIKFELSKINIEGQKQDTVSIFLDIQEYQILQIFVEAQHGI